jgi:hypothetical protein
MLQMHGRLACGLDIVAASVNGESVESRRSEGRWFGAISRDALGKHTCSDTCSDTRSTAAIASTLPGQHCLSQCPHLRSTKGSPTPLSALYFLPSPRLSITALSQERFTGSPGCGYQTRIPPLRANSARSMLLRSWCVPRSFVNVIKTCAKWALIEPGHRRRLRPHARSQEPQRNSSNGGHERFLVGNGVRNCHLHTASCNERTADDGHQSSRILQYYVLAAECGLETDSRAGRDEWDCGEGSMILTP